MLTPCLTASFYGTVSKLREQVGKLFPFTTPAHPEDKPFDVESSSGRGSSPKCMACSSQEVRCCALLLISEWFSRIALHLSVSGDCSPGIQILVHFSHEESLRALGCPERFQSLLSQGSSKCCWTWV